MGAAVAALPGLGGVREHLAQASPGWLGIAVAAELASALSYVLVLRAVFCPCMGWVHSYQLGMSELAAGSLLPAGGAGGLALGAWALHRGGMTTGHIARRTVAFFLLTSAANFGVVIVAGTASALGLLPGHAAVGLTLVPAALALGCVLGVIVLPRILRRTAARDRSASPHRIRERVRSFAVEACSTVADGIQETRSVLGDGRTTMIVAGSVGYLAFDIATLAACFQATGSLPPLGDFVLAYTIGQLGALIPLPGGLGGTEGGLIGTLVVYGVLVGPAAAAVLVYRLVQLGLPALLGLPAFIQLQRTLHKPDAFASICEPLAEDLAVARA